MPTLVNPSNQPNTLDIGPTDYRNNDANSSNIEANAICCVAGDLLKKCLSKRDCEICRDRLVVNQLDNRRKMFCLFKASDTQKSEFGPLLPPSVPFFDFFTQMEDVLLANFSKFCSWSFSVGKHILGKLNDVSAASVQASDEFPEVYLRKRFSALLLFEVCKSWLLILQTKEQKIHQIFALIRISLDKSDHSTPWSPPSTYLKILNIINNLPSNVSIWTLQPNRLRA